MAWLNESTAAHQARGEMRLRGPRPRRTGGVVDDGLGGLGQLLDPGGAGALGEHEGAPLVEDQRHILLRREAQRRQHAGDPLAHLQASRAAAVGAGTG